jgi:hypothetical protein
MSSITTTLVEFNQYLLNEHARTFARLSYYNTELTRLNRDFYQKSIRPIDVQNAMADILLTLNIPRQLWGRFLNNNELSMYEFLKEVNLLSEQKNRKLQQLLIYIEDNNQEYQRRILIATWAAVGLFGLLPPFVIVLGKVTVTTLQSLFAITLFLPVVSIIYTVGIAAYSFYACYKNKEISWEDRFRENFFNLTSSFFNVVAYSLVIAAAVSAVLNPISAAFFIVASAVMVIKEAVHLYQVSNIPLRLSKEGLFESDLDVKQENARNANTVSKQKNAVIIELVSAILMVGVVAAWCLVPGGIFVSIAAISAMLVLGIAKSIASATNASIMRSKLKTEYKSLEEASEAEGEVQMGAENHQREVLEPREQPVANTCLTNVETPMGLRRHAHSMPSQAGIFSGTKPRISLDDFDQAEEEQRTIH